MCAHERVAAVGSFNIVVQVYNCILRRFPADKYALFDEGGNRCASCP